MQLTIKDDRLYVHSHLRVNYTTYDVRRGQDSISMRTPRRDIMLVPNRSEDQINPFWYANNETLEILVTSDQLEPVSGAATLTWYSWEGKELASSSHKFTTPALNNSEIYKQSGLASILPHGTNETDVWLLLNLTATLPSGQSVTNEQYVSIFF